jgi:isocitrate/isopropylmalate dehydrogenase
VRVTRVLAAEGPGTSAFSPLAGASPDRALGRAFAAAREQGGRITAVGLTDAWRTRVELHATLHDGVDVTHLHAAEALELLSRDARGLGVAAVEEDVADAIAQEPRRAGRPQLAATGYLSPSGPGLFTPTHGVAQEIAGAGVANPSEMLLAAALLLAEGLGRRAAAEALEESLAATLATERRTPDMAQEGVAATTREFVDAVLALLPSARRDTEFALGVTR